MTRKRWVDAAMARWSHRFPNASRDDVRNQRRYYYEYLRQCPGVLL